MKNKPMYFFSETRNVNPKIAEKWPSIGNFFYQDDSEWPKMDFKHNFF